MTREEYLLSTAAEESVELAQRLIKALRFGVDQVQPPSHEEGTTDSSTNPERLSNRERVMREYYDLRATMGMAGFDAWENSERTKAIEAAKVAKVVRYLLVSREIGTLS